MSLSCGSKCAKYILVILNILLSLLALATIAMGIYILVLIGKMVSGTEYNGVQLGVLRAAAGILIGVGCAILFICWLGCCGAIKENTGCLICYAVIVFTLVAIQLVAFIMTVVFYSKMNSGLHDSLNNFVQNVYSSNPQDPATKSWDVVQSELHCCGVDSPKDWMNSAWKKNVSLTMMVPNSCCVANSTGYPVDQVKCQQFAYLNSSSAGTAYVYYQGCLQKIQESSKPGLIWLISLGLAIIFIQIFVGILACCLKSSIKGSYDKV